MDKFLYLEMIFCLCCIENGAADNSSDVFIRANHAESSARQVDFKNVNPIVVTKTTVEPIEVKATIAATVRHTEDDDGVLFIANEKQDNEGYLSDDRTVGDLFKGQRRLSDTVYELHVDRSPNVALKEPEPPKINEDVVFVSGKNSERSEIEVKNEVRKKEFKETVKRRYESPAEVNQESFSEVECSKIDCNLEQKPVCGGKIENKVWKYRLFASECFFNKVNCGFQFESNKYTLLDIGSCSRIGSHDKQPRRYNYVPPQISPRYDFTTELYVNGRRSVVSRRSNNINERGQMCNHRCPVACSEDYNPECAMSDTGVKKVFVNHCLLDYNSCAYGTEWRKLSLAECVGQQTADFRQNRAFIGWMQRIGIIDGKGRLTSQAK